MPSEYTLERITIEDWGRLKSLRVQSAQDAPEAFGSSLASMERRPDDFWSRQVEQMACFAVRDLDRGRDVGLVRGARDPDSDACTWLLGMWVDPIARGQRIGDQLACAVIEWTRALNVPIVRLEVIADNRPAIRLYERLGFTPTGHTRSLPPPRDHLTEVEYQYLL